MSLDLDELRRRLTQALERRPEVLEAYLFGSRARLRAQPHSDVDVAVFVAEIPDAPSGSRRSSRPTSCRFWARTGWTSSF